MKKVVARCKLKTPSMVNYGYLYIKEDIIEGIFTRDYVKIALRDNKILLHLTEDNFFIDENIIRHKKKVSLYQTKYFYDTLFIPEEYNLKDEKGNSIALFTECLINNQEEVDNVLKSLISIRY